MSNNYVFHLQQATATNPALLKNPLAQSQQQAYSSALTARALQSAGLVQAQAQPQQVAAGYATALSGYL